MSDTKYIFADHTELSKRSEIVEEFLNNIFDPDERPYLISDESSLHDIVGDENEIAKRIKNVYGVALAPDQFNLLIWQALDFIVSFRKTMIEVDGRCP